MQEADNPNFRILKAKYFLVLLLVFLLKNSFSQDVFQHVSNTAIYDFMDELANQKVISINSAIKPYSRKFIAEKLVEAEKSITSLTKRQKEDLAFFKRDYFKELPGNENIYYFGKGLFNKENREKDRKNRRLDLFFSKDSLFTITINPIVGFQYFTNEKEHVYHRWNGAEANAYIGKNFGFYASLRDNYESTALSTPDYLVQSTGAGFKGSVKGGVEYSEMRGGVTYSNKWASIGVIKDHFVWGNNYNGSNIFSGKTPSFAQVYIKIHPVKWFEFNYVHGWLSSEVVDSANSYTIPSGTRLVYQEKHLSANMFTFIPFKKFNISLGNSIIYSNMGSNPAYYMPVFFYKSLDHTYVTSNFGGSNAQMFFDVSSRQIKNVHIYASVFIDELNISNMWDAAKQSNFFSGKFGFRFSKIPNVSIIGEYTRTNPIAYKHFIPTTTFESNNYNLGHYLRDNSVEYYVCARIKPIRKLMIDLSYTESMRGKDYSYTGINYSGLGDPFIDSVAWKNKSVNLKFRYELFNDAYITFEYCNSLTTGEIVKYTPLLYRGNRNTLSFGFNYGF
ncbi:MAG: hypothetical protein HXX09_03395 [Bacteroidetes bacterium]|nr:hypothetical protein [Bacteroidota bacterium]